MTLTHSVRAALKRGAFVVGANWQVVAIQFIAESTFKVMLAVPVIGGAILVAVLVGGDLMELLSGELRQTLGLIAGALVGEPAALGAFVTSFLVMLLGGSALMFLIKGGTVAVLVAGEREAGPIERPPLRLASLRQAAQFTIDRFMTGCRRLFRRYLLLGLTLLATYALSGAMYFAVIYSGYQLVAGSDLLVSWTLIAALCSTALILWITVVNLAYLLLQIVMAVDDLPVGPAVAQARRFFSARRGEIGLVFAIVLVLVVLATAASLLATAGLGLISFVPFAGLAVFPLQVLAWLVRGITFQYIGLTALGAYLTMYRAFRDASALPTPRALVP